MTTVTPERTETGLPAPVTSDGDHDRFAHIVDAASSLEGYVAGSPCVALCGKVWVPSANPDRYPLCGTCDEEYERLFGRRWDRGPATG